MKKVLGFLLFIILVAGTLFSFWITFSTYNSTRDEARELGITEDAKFSPYSSAREIEGKIYLLDEGKMIGREIISWEKDVKGSRAKIVYKDGSSIKKDMRDIIFIMEIDKDE